jgi:hypothetical protein
VHGIYIWRSIEDVHEGSVEGNELHLQAVEDAPALGNFACCCRLSSGHLFQSLNRFGFALVLRVKVIWLLGWLLYLLLDGDWLLDYLNCFLRLLYFLEGLSKVLIPCLAIFRVLDFSD